MKQIIAIYKNNQDIKRLLSNLNNVKMVDIKTVSKTELFIFFIDNFKKDQFNLLLIDDSIEAITIGLIYHFLKGKRYHFWIESIKNRSFLSNILYKLAISNSKSLITRSNLLKYSLQKYKKFTNVINYWIEEIPYSEKKLTLPYKIFTNFEDVKDIEGDKFSVVPFIDDADLALIEVDSKLFFKMFPKIFFKFVENRTPVVAVSDKIKKLNKVFNGVKLIVPTEKNRVDINYLEKVLFKNFKFKTPKKYRFRFNLSKLKKILK